MNCWKTLGLTSDVDERTIKRRYSELLKVHRPDEDLEAFQRLREAYEQALAIARRRSEAALDEASAELEVFDSPFGGSDVGLAAELERPSIAVLAEDPARLEIEASLLDLTPPSLEAALAAAKAQGQQVLFEQCLLERCLNDSEHGYMASQWALARLNWLTPWQASPLSASQLDMLTGRLLGAELNGLHDTLVAGDESFFIRRVAALHDEGWLQPFDRRALFDRRLAEMLLDISDWTPDFFDNLCTACGWFDEGGHQPCDAGSWQMLIQRCEGLRLKGALRSHMAELWPARPEQCAAWMLLKPLSHSERRRLVDGFKEHDWVACQHLQSVLEYQYSELVEEFSSTGLYDWRRWMPGEAWFSSYRYLIVLFLVIYVASGWWGGEMSEDSLVGFLVHIGVGSVLAFIVIAICTKFHEGWSVFCQRFAGFDVVVSEFLLPRSWGRQGVGLLLLRHCVPAVCVGLLAWGFGFRFGDGGPIVGAVSGVLALLFADRACCGWAPRIMWAAMAKWLGKRWRALVLGLLLFVIAVSVIMYISQSAATRCTWAWLYNGLCTMTEQVP